MAMNCTRSSKSCKPPHVIQRGTYSGLNPSISGSTGNIYTIVIKHLPTCDCPDALKGNHCKHLLFGKYRPYTLC